MTSYVVEEWLRAFNANVKQQYEATCHSRFELSDAWLTWVLLNTTSVSQLMDQGVMKCVKLNYCKLLI
jgi:hypothetical protein